MAQLSMDPARAPMASLVIEIRDHCVELDDRTGVLVKVGLGLEPPTSVTHVDLRGRENDYLDTLVQSIVEAWHYREEPRDVARAAQAVATQARRHARAHDRQGSFRGV